VIAGGAVAGGVNHTIEQTARVSSMNACAPTMLKQVIVFHCSFGPDVRNGVGSHYGGLRNHYARATSVRVGSRQPLQLIVFASIVTPPDDSMRSGSALRLRKRLCQETTCGCPDPQGPVRCPEQGSTAKYGQDSPTTRLGERSMRLPPAPIGTANTNEKARFAEDAWISRDALAGGRRAADAGRDIRCVPRVGRGGQPGVGRSS
jgi:hypothetical protein